jgi:hypothetical protein
MPLPEGVAARHVMMLLMMLARLFQQANRNCMPCLLVYMQKDMEVVGPFGYLLPCSTTREHTATADPYSCVLQFDKGTMLSAVAVGYLLTQVRRPPPPPAVTQCPALPRTGGGRLPARHRAKDRHSHPRTPAYLHKCKHHRSCGVNTVALPHLLTSQIPGGALADIFGAKTVVCLAMLGSALSCLAVPVLAESYGVNGLWYAPPARPPSRHSRPSHSYRVDISQPLTTPSFAPPTKTEQVLSIATSAGSR